MSHICKVCILGSLETGPESIFAINLRQQSFEKLEEEIFARMPNLKNQAIHVYYLDDEGDRISISNASDFVIFKESGLNRVYVAVVIIDLVEESKEKQELPIATLRTEPPAERTHSQSLRYRNSYLDEKRKFDQKMSSQLKFEKNVQSARELQLESLKLFDLMLPVGNKPSSAPPASVSAASPSPASMFSASSSSSASAPHVTAADKRVQDPLAALIAMGFSNEGGWLAQLVEAADGNISRALDLLQPHK